MTLCVTKWMGRRERCDTCGCSIRKGDVTFFYDTVIRGTGGCWGLVCDRCFELFGPRQVGIGWAQKYDGLTGQLLDGGEA